MVKGVCLVQVVKDTVNIQIGDVNDNAPTFHNQPYTLNIPEVQTCVYKFMSGPRACIVNGMMTKRFHVRSHSAVLEGGRLVFGRVGVETSRTLP